jgi:hypothetical protein
MKRGFEAEEGLASGNNLPVASNLGAQTIAHA